MKLKKLISVMLIGACVCSMAACGSKKEEKKIESADDLKDAKIGVQSSPNAAYGTPFSRILLSF